MFNATILHDRYDPRPGKDADHAVFHARLKACETCPGRHGHRCIAVNQLCSVLARPSGGQCPAGNWPGEKRAAPIPIPVAPPAIAAPPALTPHASPLACAVVIVCHNYGRFLQEALDSVLAQTVPAREIVIVDDASTDNTADVAGENNAASATLGGPRGPHAPLLRYVRVEHRSVTRNRLLGLNLTTSPVVLFLDADDAIPPDYLERGLPLFDRPDVGVVYSDCQRFGDDTSFVRFPDPTGRDIVQQNFAHAGSLVRRAALEGSEAFARPDQVNRLNQDDWYLWRRIATAGWRLAKSPAVYRYRIHGDSHCAELRAAAVGYFDLASLRHETITLFIPLSGRRWAWPALRTFLEKQTWPHDQVRLVLCDTSDDADFAADVRGWLSRCDYTDARWYAQSVGPRGLADDNRHADAVRKAVQSAMPRIYNRMAREATTEYVWVIEDDILPPLDAAEKLLQRFNDEVASVSGAYPSRFQPAEFVAWDRTGRAFPRDASFQPNVTAVGGNGFGCVFLRRSVLRQTVFQHATPVSDYDPNFYHWLASTRRWRALVDWSIECEHRDAPPNETDSLSV